MPRRWRRRKLRRHAATLYDAGRAPSSAVLATCYRPRPFRRGTESPSRAARRGRLDTAIAGLLFMAGLRRSEVAALRWVDVTDADAPSAGVLIRVRTSKTNPAGDTTDLRFMKDGVAAALRALRAATQPEANDHVVPLSPRVIGRRFTAAAGIDRRVIAHSGRAPHPPRPPRTPA